MSELLPAGLVGQICHTIDDVVGLRLNRLSWLLVAGCLDQINDAAKAHVDALRDALYELIDLVQEHWRDDDQYAALDRFYTLDGNDPAAARAMAEQARAIHIPVCMIEAITKLGLIRLELVHELGRGPTVDELAKEIHLPRWLLFDVVLTGRALAPVGVNLTALRVVRAAKIAHFGRHLPYLRHVLSLRLFGWLAHRRQPA